MKVSFFFVFVFNIAIANLAADNAVWAFGVLTNEMNRYSHAEDFECHVDFTAAAVAPGEFDEALRMMAVYGFPSTNETEISVRNTGFYLLRKHGSTNDLPFLRSRIELENDYPLSSAISACLKLTDSVPFELAALTNLLHGARAGDPGFQDVATWEICSRASHSSSLELSADEVEMLQHFLITEFPVENRTTAAVWIDRYLTNAVPSWATNEARRTAAERILALPTTPLPFVTNHFVRVLASFPPPD